MHTPIQTNAAPKAIGPYSQAIRAGSLLFCSGQIGLRGDGTMVDGGLRPQVDQIMRNLEAILKAGGCTFAHVVSAVIYLTDMADFPSLNEVYEHWMRCGGVMDGQFPSRVTVGVASLPKGAIVEIAMTAVL